MIAAQFSQRARFLLQALREHGVEVLTHADCDAVLVRADALHADWVNTRPVTEEEAEDLTRRST